MPAKIIKLTDNNSYTLLPISDASAIQYDKSGTKISVQEAITNNNTIQELTEYSYSTPLAVGDTHDEGFSKLSKIIEDNEYVTAAALTYLNDNKKSKDMFVNITGYTGNYSSNKTYTEISYAIENNQTVILTYDNSYYSLTRNDIGFTFSNVVYGEGVGEEFDYEILHNDIQLNEFCISSIDNITSTIKSLDFTPWTLISNYSLVENDENGYDIDLTYANVNCFNSETIEFAQYVVLEQTEGGVQMMNNQSITNQSIFYLSEYNKTSQSFGIQSSTHTTIDWRNADTILHYYRSLTGIPFAGEGDRVPGDLTLYEDPEMKHDLMQEILWEDLRTLRDDGELIPGMKYRIIDYDCTTIQAGTDSAHNQFDVIVLALSKDTLSEEAWAIMHDNIYDVTFYGGVTKKCYIYYFYSTAVEDYRYNVVDIETLEGGSFQTDEITVNTNDKTAICVYDTTEMVVNNLQYNYFQNSNLSAWKVWYCLDNDTARFAWAQIEREGVTYYPWEQNGVIGYYTTSPNPEVGDTMFEYENYEFIQKNEMAVWQIFTTNGEVTAIRGAGDKGEIGIYNKSNSDPVIIPAVEDGKGVIYRLIDEFGNDCPYDFKNILFERDVYVPDNTVKYFEFSDISPYPQNQGSMYYNSTSFYTFSIPIFEVDPWTYLDEPGPGEAKGPSNENTKGKGDETRWRCYKTMDASLTSTSIFDEGDNDMLIYAPRNNVIKYDVRTYSVIDFINAQNNNDTIIPQRLNFICFNFGSIYNCTVDANADGVVINNFNIFGNYRLTISNVTIGQSKNIYIEGFYGEDITIGSNCNYINIECLQNNDINIGNFCRNIRLGGEICSDIKIGNFCENVNFGNIYNLTIGNNCKCIGENMNGITNIKQTHEGYWHNYSNINIGNNCIVILFGDFSDTTNTPASVYLTFINDFDGDNFIYDEANNYYWNLDVPISTVNNGMEYKEINVENHNWAVYFKNYNNGNYKNVENITVRSGVGQYNYDNGLYLCNIDVNQSYGNGTIGVRHYVDVLDTIGNYNINNQTLYILEPANNKHITVPRYNAWDGSLH